MTATVAGTPQSAWISASSSRSHTSSSDGSSTAAASCWAIARRLRESESRRRAKSPVGSSPTGSGAGSSSPVRNISCQVRATAGDRTGDSWYGRRVAQVHLDELRAAVGERLRGFGFDARTGGLIGDHYLDAELRGAATHGLERLRWLAGENGLNPRARPRLVERADGLARWDGSGAVGYVALADALAAEASDPPGGARL